MVERNASMMIVNALVRQALTSAQEVMGENGLNAVLRTSELERFIGNFPPDNLEPSIRASEYAKLNAAIEADDAHPLLRKAAVKMMDGLRQSLIAILDNGIRYKQLKATIHKEYYATIIIASLEGAIMMSKLYGNNEAIKLVIKHLETLIPEITV